MINGFHTVLFADDPVAARAFFRDVLGFANVDVGDGWLIFKTPPSELGVHPAQGPDSGRADPYLMCDDIQATVLDLTARGAHFLGEIQEQRFGLVARMLVPGAGEMGLYEPKHVTAVELPG
jgi:catechol 2,3-dioxygenase-like lactoylglutathione lyase family enzyme